MFTGIVQQIGEVERIAGAGRDRRVQIALGAPLRRRLETGDSMAVNGVCLTAVEAGERHFAADISVESLRLTTLGMLEAGARVNLEPALTLADPLGGHLVSGHVDGQARVLDLQPTGDSAALTIEVPEALLRYIAPKGSVCIDGVSLTVNAVDGDCISIHLVPHTLEHTIMGAYTAGTRVNIEVDLLARYLERLQAD